MIVDTPYIFPNKWNDLKIITKEKLIFHIEQTLFKATKSLLIPDKKEWSIYLFILNT